MIKNIYFGFRLVVGLLLVAALGYGGWRVWQAFDGRSAALALVAQLKGRIDEQDHKIAQQERQIQTLQTALRLLKVDHRVGRLEVLDQRPAADHPGKVITKVRFVEEGSDGEALGRGQTMELLGNVAFVDALVIKFEDRYVEQGDALRGTSLCLFRRIFGEFQTPSEGYPLDAVGARPAHYSPGDAMTDFERDLWAKFWDYANDADKAAAVGVRTIGGAAPYVELRPGHVYQLQLRASGGLSILPGRPVQHPAAQERGPTGP